MESDSHRPDSKSMLPPNKSKSDASYNHCISIKVVDRSKKSGSFACLPTSLAHHGRFARAQPMPFPRRFYRVFEFFQKSTTIFINLIIAIPLFNWIETPFDIVFVTVFHQILNFFLLKLSVIYTFWIVLMC